MDKLDASRRSANMSRIRSKHTKPELLLRSMLHEAGYRFRLHRKDLPGKPDIVFPGRKKVIFVHGCFWHQHSECREGRLPATRLDYWVPKLQGNVQRHANAVAALTQQGWSSLILWDCQIQADTVAALSAAERFLDEPQQASRQNLDTVA